MKRKLAPRQYSSTNTPLIITNYCAETIYPGITTQGGTGPQSNGFELQSGGNFSQDVSADWQGRVWGRTNCSFNSQGTGPANSGGSKYQACDTGDCNGVVDCKVTGNTPVTLAEFTLNAGDGQTYYDISLVDGYNLPMAIVLVPQGNASLLDIPPNLTNPSCVGTAGDLNSDQYYDPYTSGFQTFLGTNSSFPLPFDTKVTSSQASDWCPWDLQVNIPTGPGNGVYSYPDASIQRPVFDPCYSACAKYNDDADCSAKAICPDAYSYAFDDQTSTFIIPAGAGFEVVFCPGARSTNILATEADKLSQLKSSGSVNKRGIEEALPKRSEAFGVFASGRLVGVLVALAATAAVFVTL
ncbi:hypothetical protein B0A49_03447 [Cryomyces minteri]|uniref:Thaumatin-like protein 1 n=1 Tax=Cryomyces minteri TaxID=331657 RepID=A0A4V5NF02_9PEZI|nr:hypothetical protein B0A49_03447 [Cryomyces minteri]